MTSFEPFGHQHWIATAVTIGVAVLIPELVRRRAGMRARNVIGKLLALCLLGYLIVSPVILTGYYTIPLIDLLPLHLCRLAVLIGVFMLWLKSYRLYEVVYFWGTGATFAALAFPDLLAGFPHPLFLLFFVGHGLALMAVIYATRVVGFRPRLRSVGVALTVTGVYALLMYPVNLLLGSNFLFIMRKPAQPSPLDYFGPWPWYVVWLIVLTIIVHLLCYMPFAIAARYGRSLRRTH